jgi:hypothetical protein
MTRIFMVGSGVVEKVTGQGFAGTDPAAEWSTFADSAMRRAA